MSPSRRTAALFGLLALLLLPAVWPYAFAYGDLPRTNDIATHIYRAFELEQLLDTGVFFPRWGPHLVHGYGYPIFHYFGYLSHYLIALLHKAGANYLWAYRLASSGVTLLAGWGAFLLGREMARGERGGLLAGVAFVYSPYMLYTANVRGGLPESLALALLPFVLLTWRRAARDGWRYVVPGGLAYGALVFSHNGIALQSSPLILAFALWSGRARWRGAFARIAACLALGLGLAAFYWIPALVELRFVQVESRFATTGISYAVNFAALRDLFAYPALPVDSDLLNPPVLRPLSVAALALAGTALLIGWRARDALQRDRGLLAVLAAAGIFIALPASRFIWEVVPLLQRSLWPWRYLGPASLFIALLAGTLGSAHVPPHRVAGAARPVLLPLFVVALFIANSVGWLFPPREQIAPPESVADLARYELPPLLIGTSTNAEYLPRWVTELPDTTAQRELLLSEDDPDRLDRASLPPGAGSVHTGSNLFWDQWLVDLPEESVLQFRQFYFPGWRLLIDGEPVPARITAPHGLIAIEAPAGEHSIQLRFESTPIRRFADLASLVSALLVAAYFIARVTKHVSRRGKLRSTFSQIPIPGFTNLRYLSLTALLLCSLFIATWFIDSPLRTHGLAPGNGPTGMEHALAADLGGELRLLGYTLSSDALPADGETELDLYWQAQRELGLSYGFNVRLLDSEGRVWNSSEIVRPADWRFIPGTDFWPPDQYVRDSYVLRPLAGTPPGEYQLHVVAFRADTLVELDTVAVAALRIVAPDRTAYVSASALHTFADDQLELLEVRIDRSAARPGDPVRADLVWRAGPAFATAADLQLALQIVADGDSPAETLATAVVGGSFPTSRWKPGDVIADQLLLRLPAGLAAGAYQWRIAVPPAGQYEPDRTLEVAAIQRTFDARLPATAVQAPLGEQVLLVGFDLATDAPESGAQLDVELVWQARAEMDQPLRVFVHLLDAKGNIVAQSDAEPAQWTRPTTGWLVGEYVRDRHTLPIPADLRPGAYFLHAGIYDPASGRRLVSSTVPDGSLLLASVDIASP